MSRPISTDPVSLEFQVFNTQPIICQVLWGDEYHVDQCINTAVWIADCHDEFEHTDEQILFCDECKIVAEHKNKCECGKQLVHNIRQL